MQFLWKYIDDLMGKGLEMSILFELLFYVSATLVPLALPIAVLFSSIMTMGNLAEHSELTAMKASGISLFKAMRPILLFMLFLSAGAFYFANYMLPIANFKWRVIIYDIQAKKPTFGITPGVFYNDIDGYSIRVMEKNDNTGELTKVLIYENGDFKNYRTITAESGEMLKSENEQFLLLKLKDGIMYQRLGPGLVNKAMQGYQKWYFTETVIKFDLSDFGFQNTSEDLFKTEHEMMNVWQLTSALDSLNKVEDTLENKFFTNFRNNMIIYNEFYNDPVGGNPDSNLIVQADQEPIDTIIFLDSLHASEKMAALANAQTEIRQMRDVASTEAQFRRIREDDLVDYRTEWHKKFTLSVAIIILFFIGAPLGAIIKKGGLGAPLVFATLFFLLYYILTILGQNMVQSRVLIPWWGMWMSTILLTPLGMFLTYKAANDSALFDRDVYKRWFRKIFKPLYSK